MPKSVLHVGDEGVWFLTQVFTRNAAGVRVVQDLTGATEIVVKWRKENGVVVEADGSVYGEPEDGWILAVAPAGMLDQVGKGWAISIELQLGSFHGNTSQASFEVDYSYAAA